MHKDEREWAVLRTVYAVDRFGQVAHRDAPDFELRHHGSDASFGVEITELYETPSDARAHNHPDYIPQLLAGERHMHPEDERVLLLSARPLDRLLLVFCRGVRTAETGACPTSGASVPSLVWVPWRGR